MALKFNREKHFHEQREHVVERKAQDPALYSGVFSAPMGLTVVSQPLHATHRSDLAPVPRVSELRLQILIGFGVLHIKPITSETWLSTEDMEECFPLAG